MSNTDITPAQMRAALAMLKWDYRDLANASGLSVDGLSRIFLEKHEATATSRRKIKTAFEARDIEFLPNDGLRRAFGEIKRIEGAAALNRFLDDVYSTVRLGGDICVSGVRENDYDRFYDNSSGVSHSTRMTAIRDKITCRVLLQEDDNNFAYGSYIQYRWMPKAKFSENSFYLYGNKLAFLNFGVDTLQITVITQPSAAAAFRYLFDVAWAQAIQPPQLEGIHG